MNAEETDLNTEIRNLLECCICTELFNEPRILPCIHTFCLKCLQLTGEEANLKPGDKMSCPLCREEFVIPQLGWSNLKTNFFMQRLVEIHVSKSLTPTVSRILCDVCQSNCELESNDKIPSASVHCVECEDNLCEKCHGEHKRHKLSKGHQIVTECRIKQKQYKCDTHEMENMTKYCATCRKIICNTCSIEGHSSHSCSDVEKIAEMFGEQIESYIKDADVFIEELSDVKRKMDLEKEKFHNDVKAKEIELAKSSIKLTDIDRKIMMQKIVSNKYAVEKQYAIESDDIKRNLVILDSFKMYCKKISLEGLPCEICSSFDEICSQAELLQQKMHRGNSKKCRVTQKNQGSENDERAETVPGLKTDSGSHFNEDENASSIQALLSLINPKVGEMLKDCEYMKIHPAVERSTVVGDYQAFWNRVLPYIIQSLKMWNGHVLYPQNLSDLISEEPKQRARKSNLGDPLFPLELRECESSDSNVDFPFVLDGSLSFEMSKLSCESKETPNYADPFFYETCHIDQRSAIEGDTHNKSNSVSLEYPVSRLDIVAYIFNTADCFVAQDILRIMSKYPMTLPFILPDISCNDKYIVTLPLLKNLTQKWESKPGSIIENHLFSSPFRMVVAIRLGSGEIGKSVILNQLMAKRYTFSSCTEPGHEFGRPYTLDGTVEIICLTQETCSDTTWKKVREYYKTHDAVAILANLHGDAMKYQETLEYIKQFAAAFVVFLMPNASEGQWKDLNEMLKEKRVWPIRVVEKQKKGSSSAVPWIETSSLLNDNTHDVVRKLMLDSLNDCSDCRVNDDFSLHGNLRLVSDFRTPESCRLVEFVKKHGCSRIKEFIRTVCNGGENRWVRNADLCTLVNLTLDIFKNQSAMTSKKALSHLKIELSKLSAADSLTGRSKVIEARENLRRMVKPSKTSSDSSDYAEFQNRQREARNKLKSALDEIDNITLGQEHFFLLIGDLYERWRNGNLKCDSANIQELLNYYAELLIGGHEIELLNGDSGRIQLTWLRAICRRVQEQLPSLKVFVISIIGLQSSGKSTLLNALFSCRFAVSVGRSSRGLFMRMIFLDNTVRRTYNYEFDAVIVIDTEGLCSPEKMNDSKSEQKDRLMATYAIGVSNLTIVNIQGEGLTEMTEILQIAFIAIARLREGGIKPDLIMVQHLQERNTNKVDLAKSQFCDAVNNAFELINKNDVEIGSNCSECLEELTSRIQSGDLFEHFGPFKDGSSVNSPPSETYHEDIVNLYKKIMERTKSLESKFTFARWSQLFESYWTCVTKENFALNFRNVKHITDFLYFEKRVAKVKELLSSSFRCHRERHSKEIREIVSTKIKKKLTIETESLLEKIITLMQQKLEHIPMTCSEKRCKTCKEFVLRHDELLNELKESEWREDIKRTLEKHTNELKETTIKMLKQTFHVSVVRQGCFSNFSDLISRELKQVLSDRPNGSFTPQEKKNIENHIWNRLKEIAESKDTVEDLPTKFFRALKQEYKNVTPQVIENFETEVYLGRPGGSKKSLIGKIRRRFVPEPKQSEEEELDCSAVGHALEGFVKKFLIDKKSDCYRNGMQFEEGMVTEIRAKFPTEIKKQEEKIKRVFPNKKISDGKKIELQIFTLQKLKQELEKLQNLWNRENKQSEILNQKEQKYRNEIETRLNSGFSNAAEGEVQADKLIEAIKHKALKAGYDAKVAAIMDLSWTTDSQSVRLQYFETLALDVAAKNNESALKHFESPKRAIEMWFNKAVDSWPTEEIALQKYEYILKGELDNLLQEIRVSTNTVDVDKIVQQRLKANDDQYFSKLDIKDDDFMSFRNSIERKLEDYSQSNLRINVAFKTLSEDPEIRSRLGCTEHCFWCGALCWGSSEHKVGNDDNIEIEKHHTCHQPNGLVGIHFNPSRELISQACHNRKDADRVNFREFRGMLWSKAKQDHFKDWKFTPHYVTKFEEMMRWFFQELHQDIARDYNLVPASAENLTSNGCVNLNLDVILETVRGWK